MFTWNPQKASINFDKHGVSFDEAATVFADPNALDWEDIGHSEIEIRLKRLGISHSQRVLIVVYTIRSTVNGIESIRIISARQASQRERKAYAG